MPTNGRWDLIRRLKANAKAIMSGAIVPITYIISLYYVMITEDQGQLYFYNPCNKTNCSCGQGSSL